MTDDALDIVVIGGTAWDDGVNQPSNLAVRKLAESHRVLYVYSQRQSSVLRDVVARKESPAAMLGSLRRASVTRVDGRLWTCRVHGLLELLPMSYPEPLRRLQLRAVARVVRRGVLELGFDRPVLWFYWWFFPELTTMLDGQAAIYDCVDDHQAYEVNRSRTRLLARSRQLECETVERVDLTYCVSQTLVDKLSSPTRVVAALPNGVDEEFVYRSLSSDETEPDVECLSRPIVGYGGGLQSRIDWDLVAAVALNRPEMTFAFVGDGAPLLELPPNVAILSGRPYGRMLRAMRSFDVGVIPFGDDEFSRACSPMKLLDYLAVGLPIVATPFPAALEFRQRSPGWITVAGDVEAFALAIDGAMAAPKATVKRERERREVLSRSSAAARVARVVEDLRSRDQSSM